jgi:hypothetical protein
MPTQKSNSEIRQNQNTWQFPCRKIHQTKSTNYKNQGGNKIPPHEKTKVNGNLYHLHLQLANTWGKSWKYIQDVNETKFNRLMKGKYERLDTKLRGIVQTQTRTPTEHHNFYPRVVNNTNITFTDDENNLFNKGFKYNLHHKKNNWLTNLTLEAETAINHLPHTIL